MGLGSFISKGIDRIGKAVNTETHRLGSAIKNEANRVSSSVENIVDTAKNIVEGGKVVKDQIGNLVSRSPNKSKDIDTSQFDDVDLEKAKSRGDEKHLTNQYNYAGPGTFFHARQKGSAYYENLMKATGHKVKGTKPYDKPFNALDSCAVAHDRAYANPNKTPTQIQKADKDFQTCITTIQNPDRQQALLIKGAMKGFSAKLKAEDIGIMKKGSLSDSNSKESTGNQLKRLAQNAVKFLP